MTINKQNIIFTFSMAFIIIITTAIGLTSIDQVVMAASFWPVAGFYVAFYVIYRKKALPGIIIGLVFVNVVRVIIEPGESVLITLLLGFLFIGGNLLEIFVFDYLLQVFKVDAKRLGSINNGYRFVAIILCTALIGSIIPIFASFIIRGTDNLVPFILRYPIGNFLGMLVFGALIIDSYYKDKTLNNGLLNITKSVIYLVIYIFTLYFVFDSFGNDFITLENFQIVIVILYLVTAFTFSYRMIIVNNLLFLLLVHVLYLNGLSGSDYTLQSVMISIYLISLSTITVIVRNILLERQKSYEHIELQKVNLEKMIISTNNLFNIEDKLPEEALEFSKRYLKDMFNLACDLYPKFTNASCYIKGEKYVEYVDALNFDKHFLNKCQFDPTYFKWDLYKPEIIKSTDNHLSIKNKKDYNAYHERYEEIKESIRFTVNTGEKSFAGMSFDILVGNPDSFDETDLANFESFQRLMNSYYSVGSITSQNNSLKDDIVRSSVKTLELYDSYTESHSDEVSQLSLEVGRSLKMKEGELRQLYWAALVHDIGKIGVSSEILNKQGKLTKEEYNLVKKHSEFGYDVLSKSKGLEEIAKIVRHHHEWWNGNGYPDGLKELEIPYASQIINVCDAVSAMSHKRTYKSELTKEQIIEQLEQGLGFQFSPKIAKFMIKFIKDGRWESFLKELKKDD